MDIDQATIVVIPTTATQPPAGARKATIFVSESWLSHSIDAHDLLPFDTYSVSFYKEFEDRKPDIKDLNNSSLRHPIDQTSNVASSHTTAVKRESSSSGQETGAGSNTSHAASRVPTADRAVPSYALEKNDNGQDVVVLLDSDDEGEGAIDDDDDDLGGALKRFKKRKTHAKDVQKARYDVAECQKDRVQEIINALRAWRRVGSASKQDTVKYLRTKVKFEGWVSIFEANRPYIIQNVPGMGDRWGTAASKGYKWE